MQPVPLLSACASLAFAAAPAAQLTLPAPLAPGGTDPGSGALVLQPRGAAIAQLESSGASLLTVTDLALTPELRVELELERVPLDGLRLGFEVDGQPAPGLLDGLDLSVWKGRVAGAPQSEALLSFSRAGSRGWVSLGAETFHLLPQPGPGWDWSQSYTLVTRNRDLAALGVTRGVDCAADRLAGNVPSRDAVPHGSAAPPGATVGGATTLYECSMAIETDYQLHEVFGGDLGAQSAYVTTLLAAASDRYVEELDTRLVYPYVQFYTEPSDPWTTGDSGGNSIDMLDELVAAWGGSPLPGDAVLGHLLSGSSLGGGVAYLGVLCDTANDFTFGVSGNIEGTVPFPVQQGPINWDFIVFTHETGHNFSSPHTHDYCPPLDECAPMDYWGSCQDEQACVSDGTLMSYCHLCSGGYSNITTFFHPTVVEQIQPHVEGCLPTVAGISASPPAVIAPGVPTPLTATVDGSPTGSVELSYRFGPGQPYTSVAMAAQGGGAYGADLPPAACTDQPEFFFSVTEATLGLVQTEVFAPTVGVADVTFADDFQLDLGWTVGAPDDDATTGQWERVDPNGTSAQPSEGVDTGSGPFCFVTGQGPAGGGLGDADVDGGKTTLFSPVFDLTGQDEASISYWRWYSNSTGAEPNADVFTVEITGDGASWVTVETVGPAGPETNGGWFYHELNVADFVAPTSQVQVRFVAADEPAGSLVEAAVDEFQVYELSCDVCQPDLGFGGPGTAALSLCGEPLLAGNAAELSVTGAPPDAPTLLLFSSSFAPTPILGGTLVPVPVEGSAPGVTDAGGELHLAVGGGGGPGTFYVQAALVEPGTGEVLFSNAVQADFQ